MTISVVSGLISQCPYVGKLFCESFYPIDLERENMRIDHVAIKLVHM